MTKINLSLVQQKIVDNLQTLVDAGTLGSYIMDEGALDLAVLDLPKDPCAVLFPPAIESTAFDTSNENAFVLRFELAIIRNGNNVTEKYSTSDLMSALIAQFDSDPTLKGAGDTGAVVDQAQPATVEHFTTSTPEKTLVIFMLTLKYLVIASWR